MCLYRVCFYILCMFLLLSDNSFREANVFVDCSRHKNLSYRILSYESHIRLFAHCTIALLSLCRFIVGN